MSETSRTGGAPENGVVRGRIRQSIVFWCFNIAGEKWDLDKMCRVTRDLGLEESADE